MLPIALLLAQVPVGLQFLGRPFDEATLFRVAYAFEQATMHRKPPALFPECGPAPAAAAGRRLQSAAVGAEGDATAAPGMHPLDTLTTMEDI